MAVKLSPEALARKTKYNIEYTRKFMRSKNLQFNTQIPEDIALFDWIKSQKGENATAYLKRLIREDMERQKQSAE